MAPPMMAFSPARIVRVLLWGEWIIMEIIIRGASFCHVDRIKQDIHEIEDITRGYHM